MALAAAAGAFLALGASYWHVSAPYPLEYERFGVGLHGAAGDILRYDLEALGAGWYLNWGVAMDPPHPNGVAFLQTVRLRDGSPIISEEGLSLLVRGNPGSVWQIANEPDSIWMDNATPGQYAAAYHDLYHVIKAEDPTAQVANGGLVQATPLRMLYLDHAWQAYQNLYGEEMPVDVWMVHGFILNEERHGWGAEIPPGMGAYAGYATRRGLRDHDSMAIFAGQIERFRQWMADHGQQDKPLVVSEYGILMPSEYADEDGVYFTNDRVIAFMHATFDYFRTAVSDTIGYPADGHRLVQAWAWYVLDDNTYSGGQTIGWGYNGDLFTGAYTKTTTALGAAYAQYISQTVGIGPAYTDLSPLRLEADLAAAVWGQSAPITLTAEVVNHGRQAGDGVEVQFWDGDPEAGGAPIGAPRSVGQVPGRYEGSSVVSATWTTPVSGVHAIWVDVDPAGAITESDEANNRMALALELMPDFQPGSLTFEPQVPFLEGEAVTVTVAATVANAGRVAAPAGGGLALWLGQPGCGAPAAQWALGAPLAPGAEAVVTTSLPLTIAGRYTVTLEADPGGVVAELDEGNNVAGAALLVAARRVHLPLVVRGAAPVGIGWCGGKSLMWSLYGE